MRTVYVIQKWREISTNTYNHEIDIAPEKASHKHRGFSRGILLKQFFLFFVFIFLSVVEIDFHLTVSTFTAKKF